MTIKELAKAQLSGQELFMILMQIPDWLMLSSVIHQSLIASPHKAGMLGKEKQVVRVFFEQTAYESFKKKHQKLVSDKQIQLMQARPKIAIKAILDFAERQPIDGILIDDELFVEYQELVKAFETYLIDFYRMLYVDSLTAESPEEKNDLYFRGFFSLPRLYSFGIGETLLLMNNEDPESNEETCAAFLFDDVERALNFAKDTPLENDPEIEIIELDSSGLVQAFFVGQASHVMVNGELWVPLHNFMELENHYVGIE